VEAEACRAEEDRAAEHWHLSQLLQRLPFAPSRLLARRGQAALALGREKEAAADFARLLEQDEQDVDAWIWSARAALAVGDPDAYRRACTGLFGHFNPNDPLSQRRAAVARTFLLAPGAAADLTAVLKLLPWDWQDRVTQTTRGGLLLRAGQTAEAIAELQKAAAQTRADEAPVAELLLAIALHNQGHGAEARRVLERARFVLEREAAVRQALHLSGGEASGPLPATAALATLTVEPPRWDWPTQQEVRLFRREAEALLAPAPEKPGR
jgi:tetratricopeptide (TPR) repeat protein